MALFLSVLAAIVLSACGLRSAGDTADLENYEKAVDLYNEGLYAEAKQYFLLDNNYSNTSDFLAKIAEVENNYSAAVSFVDAREYQEAYRIFTAMPKYENSQEYISYIDGLAANFTEGERLYSEGKYFEARALFVAACSYSASDSYLANIDAMAEMYNFGVELMNSGKYLDAIKAFEGIGTVFEDSDELIALCRERLLTKPCTLSEFIGAFNAQYPDGSVKISSGSTDRNFTLVDSRGVIIIGNADDNGFIYSLGITFPAELVSSLDDEGFREAVARFIFALNPNFCTFDELISKLDDYIYGDDIYGCMSFSMYNAGGNIIIESERVHVSVK